MSPYLYSIVRVPYLFLQPAFFCWKTINKCRAKPCKEEDNYDRSFEQSFKVKEKDFLDKHRIRQDLRIQEKVIPGTIFLSCTGSNRGASATIYLDPEVKKIDPHLYTWHTKHAIGRILRNTDWKIPLWQATVTGISACVLQYFNQDLNPEQSSIPVAAIRFFSLTIIIGTVGEIAGYILNKKEEEATITFAIENTTLEEQLSGRRQLKVIQNLCRGGGRPADAAYKKLVQNYIEKIEESLTTSLGKNLFCIDKSPDEIAKRERITPLVKKRYSEWNKKTRPR